MQEQEVRICCLFKLRKLLTLNRYAMDIVRECAEAWDRLITGKTPKDKLDL